MKLFTVIFITIPNCGLFRMSR